MIRNERKEANSHDPEEGLDSHTKKKLKNRRSTTLQPVWVLGREREFLSRRNQISLTCFPFDLFSFFSLPQTEKEKNYTQILLYTIYLYIQIYTPEMQMGIHLFPKREKKEEKKMRYVFFLQLYSAYYTSERVRTTSSRHYIVTKKKRKKIQTWKFGRSYFFFFFFFLSFLTARLTCT